MSTDDTGSVLDISRFDKTRHDRSQFQCGFAPIDHFLKFALSDHTKTGLVVAYMATRQDDAHVLGFYTLGAMAVRADLGPKSWQRARVPDVPAIYLRAVAVRLDQQGRGLGSALLVDALRRCQAVSEQMGAAAVVLDVLQDAETERRWAFYRNLGFRSLKDPDNPARVFMPMADIRASLK